MTKGINEEGELICLICEQPIEEDDLLLSVHQAYKRWPFGGFGAIHKNFPYYVHLDCVRVI